MPEGCPDSGRRQAIESSDRSRDSGWRGSGRWPSLPCPCCACRIQELLLFALDCPSSMPPLAKPLGGCFHALLAGDFQRGGSIEADLAQLIHDFSDADHAIAERYGGHAAAVHRAAFRFHFPGHVFPMHVADPFAKRLHELMRIAAAE